MSRLLVVTLCAIALPTAAQQANWYYCDPLHAYYPYVQTCPAPWRAVPTQADKRLPDATTQQDQKAKEAAAAAEKAKQEQQEAEHRAAEYEARRAILASHPQWQSGKDDPNAVFRFLGVTFGDATSLGAWEFRRLGSLPVRGHPEIKLYGGWPKDTEKETVQVTEKNGKDVGLIYSFPSTEATIIAKRLVDTYGDPDSTEPTEWQNAFGTTLTGTLMRWNTPVGIMQFDDRSENATVGRVVINPDEALDSTALQGLPPDKF